MRKKSSGKRGRRARRSHRRRRTSSRKKTRSRSKARFARRRLKKGAKRKAAAKRRRAPAGREGREKSHKMKKLLAHPAVSDSLLRLAGENAPAVLGQMEGAMSDEEIARACKFKVSDVRAVLNKLHAQGIAVYERTRDKDTGWYYYKWSADLKAVERMLQDMESQEKAAIEERLKYERSYSLYICRHCAQEKYPFEVALDYLFKCPNCGSALEFYEPEAAAKPSEGRGGK